MNRILLTLIVLFSTSLVLAGDYKDPVKVDVDQFQKQSSTNKNTNNNVNIVGGGKGGNAEGGQATSNSSSSSDNSVIIDTVDNHYFDHQSIDNSSIGFDNYHGGVHVEDSREFVNCNTSIGQHTIGETSVSVGGLSLCAGAVRGRGNRDNGLGGSITYTWLPGQGKALEKAQAMQEYKLHVMKVTEARTQEMHSIEITQIVENHEVKMAKMCVALHRSGALVADGFAEICKSVSFTDAEHTPMPDVESHQRIGKH